MIRQAGTEGIAGTTAQETIGDFQLDTKQVS